MSKLDELTFGWGEMVGIQQLHCRWWVVRGVIIKNVSYVYTVIKNNMLTVTMPNEIFSCRHWCKDEQRWTD